ncbi:MAG: type II and III secretion system protein [Lentisphaerae bacterium]|nr:type II and III secretion system protein [Lentisphaerota bacterium]
MKKSLLLFAVAGAFSCFAAEVVPGTPRDLANEMSSGFKSPAVNTELKVSIDEKTNEVRFDAGNSDPYVYTKAYRLKSADPYIARAYVRNTVEAKQVNASPVQVSALKYTDGTAFLLVSAEEYRFKDNKNGEGIDSIIAKLDKKDLANVSNDSAWVYFPKHLPAATLMSMLKVVGTNQMDPQFVVSPDSMLVDAELNMLMVCAPEWSGKIIKEMLVKYDKPIPEVRIGYKVIEIFAENDDRIGVDFQSWKNNEGVDLFSAGARVRRNWSSFFHGGVDNNGSNRTSYWNFNPKWNTRYLDFLTSIGKAKVLTSGTLLAKNREISSITLNYGYFYERNDYSVDEGYGMGEFAYTDPNPNAIYRQQLAKILPETLLKDKYFSDLSIAAFTPRMINYHDGVPIWKPNITDKDGNLTSSVQSMISQVQSEVTKYATEVATKLATEMVKAGKLQMTEVQGFVTNWVTKFVTEYMNKYANDLSGTAGTLFSWFTKGDTSVEGFPGIIHGKLQYPMAQDGFLFNLKVRPVVTGAAATIEFAGNTVSLLGWNSDGSPRVSDSDIKTKFQAGYGNQEFVIGGLRRTETVRSVAGLPFLKDIPVLGLLFSTENESIKQSQLVVVATVELSAPRQSGMTADNQAKIEKSLKKVNKGVDSKVGNMFFQQYGIDTDEIK